MTAEDSTPGSGENASEIATDEQRRLSDRFAGVYDEIHVALIEAGKEIEAGEADAETVERLRETVDDAREAVDELEEFVEEQ